MDRIGYCTWDDNTGLPSNNPPSTDPNCPATAVSHPGTPSMSATGSGAWSPLNPGVPATVPEVGSVMMLATELLLVLVLVAGARKRLTFSSRSVISRMRHLFFHTLKAAS